MVYESKLLCGDCLEEAAMGLSNISKTLKALNDNSSEPRIVLSKSEVTLLVAFLETVEHGVWAYVSAPDVLTAGEFDSP